MGVAENGEPALREDVELDQADIFHGVHIEMRGWPAFVALEGRSEVVDRTPREDEPAGMHLGMSWQTLQTRSKLQRGEGRLFIEKSLRLRGGGRIFRITRFGQPGEMLGQPPHKPIRHTKDFSDFSDSRPRMEGVEPADHCDMAGLVQTEDLFDNRILPVMWKIQVDVGEFFQSHAVAV